MPIPRFVTHPLFLAVLAALHLVLGGQHAWLLVGGPVTLIDAAKAGGALFGGYVLLALALRSRAACAPRVVGYDSPS